MSRLDRKRRDTDFTEAEVMGAIVVALLRLRIRNNSYTNLSCNIFCRREKCCALGSVENHIAHAAELGNRVVVEVEREAAGGNRRMLPEKCGAEESLLFGGNCGEIDRAFRSGFRVRPHPRHLA